MIPYKDRLPNISKLNPAVYGKHELKCLLSLLYGCNHIHEDLGNVFEKRTPLKGFQDTSNAISTKKFGDDVIQEMNTGG